MPDSIEDIIRRIVRDEIARSKQTTVEPLVPPFDFSDVRIGMMEKCPACGRKDFSTCANTYCYMRLPIASYPGSPQHPPVYNPPGSGFVAYGREDDTTPIVPRRTGCACPPGTTSAMCPHANCPWKPQ